MKKISLLFIALISVQCIMAQKPAYPSKEQVLKDAKTAFTLNSIIQIFNAPLTWDKIKLEYKQFVNGGELMESRFSDYQSVLAKKGQLDYDDMTDVYLLATTPKDTEGKYYEMQITVTYTRYGGPIPSTKWTFKGTDVPMEGYYQKGGNAGADAKRVESVLAVLKNYKGKKNTPDKPVNFYLPLYEFDIVKIDSIYVDKSQQDKTYTYQRFWYYIMKATVSKKEGNAYTFYKDAEIPFEIEWGKEGGEKDWSVKTVSIAIYDRHLKNNILTGADLGLKGSQMFKPLTVFGFNAVYKKMSITERNRHTLADMKDFTEKLEKVYQLIYDNPEAGRQELESMVDPEAANKKEIADSYYNPIVDAKKYLCKMEDIYTNIYGGDESDENEPSGRKLNINNVASNVSFKREAAEDKAKLKEYKDAGISKETIKATFGGRYDESWKTEIKLVFKNNTWYLSDLAEPAKKFN